MDTRDTKLTEAWKAHVAITYVDKFDDYGCNFSGHLAVVRGRIPLGHHPRNGEFGSMSCVDVSVESGRQIKDRHSGAKMLLGMPDVVMRIDEAEWTERRNVD